MASIRSLSLTRNSLTPRMIVGPSALAATTARIGYSSIMEAARPGGTSTPRIPSENRARRSAAGSPPSRRLFSNSKSAPISCRVS